MALHRLKRGANSIIFYFIIAGNYPYLPLTNHPYLSLPDNMPCREQRNFNSVFNNGFAILHGLQINFAQTV